VMTRKVTMYETSTAQQTFYNQIKGVA